MVNQPMISIILPTYNRVDKIMRPINSILEQTYKNWELIVVDDGSDDNTEEIVKQKEIPNLKYIRSKKNRGASYARNIGIKYAEGSYIAFIDSDDLWYSHHLEESLTVLCQTGYSICSALWDEEYESKKKFIGDDEWFVSKLSNLQKEQNIDIDEKILKFDNNFLEYLLKNDYYCFQINTVVLKKEILKEIGMFNEELNISEDIEFLYRVFFKYPLVVIKNSHFLYHYGSDNLWAFVDREENFTSFSKEVKEKLYNYLENKIKFYLLMKNMVIKWNGMSRFNEFEAIIEMMDFCIVRRCLTLMYSRGKEHEKYNYYNLLARKYANSNDLKFLMEHYEEVEILPRYFYLY